MEIKVGDYVRIVNDYRVYALGIGKILKIDNEYIYTDMHKEELNGLPMQINKKYIVKHSNNIIDLIEVGDILRILDNLGGCEHKVDIDDKIFLEETKNNFKDKTWKLLSILTHEQFSSLEYII